MDSLRWTSSETVLTTSTSCSQTSTCLVCSPKALPCKLLAAERAAKRDAAVQPNACLRCRADMDGFKLLEHIGLELGLPVISALPLYRPLSVCTILGAPSMMRRLAHLGHLFARLKALACAFACRRIGAIISPLCKLHNDCVTLALQ